MEKPTTIPPDDATANRPPRHFGRDGQFFGVSPGIADLASYSLVALAWKGFQSRLAQKLIVLLDLAAPRETENVFRCISDLHA